MSFLHSLVCAALLALAVPVTAHAATPAGRHLATHGRRKAPKKKAKKKARKKPTRPSEQKASTKGLEEQLKKTEEPSEQAPLAPAKLEQGPGGSVTKDAQADKARDEAIDQIKKILPKMRDPSVQADLLFQLAELWWEKSRYVKLNEEDPAWQKAADDWVRCRQQRGDKACGLEPRPNNRKSELYRKNAVDLYTTITHKYPHYARLDEIFYILAYNKYDYAQGVTSKREKDKATNEALDAYRQLIARYPHSKFIASAFVQLGNYYFDQNKLAPARKAFEEAWKLHDPKTETFALYKLAWCDINDADWPSALARFKEVVVRGTRAKNGDDRIRLKSEALRDSVRVFGELAAFDKAIEFYEQYAGKQGAWRYINMLANYNFNAGGEKQEMAIRFYRYMIAQKPMDPSAPEWQSKIVLSYDKLSQRDKVRDEMKVLVDNYKPGSSWYAVNKSDKFHIQSAYSLTEEALYNLVTDYHQEAMKTKSVATYKLARDMYAEYIENFPDSERAYDERFYYAEILYALEDYQAAYEQYLQVALDKKHDDYKKQGATNMLLAAEKLVDIEAGRYTKKIDLSSSDDSVKVDEDQDKGEIEKSQMKVTIDAHTPPQPLTALEKQLVKACDDYTTIIPNADDEARVRLRAAVIYFDRIQYVEAAKRFGYIINKWPEDKTSASAASLILESLEVKEQWDELNKLAREFAGNKRLLAGQGKDELKRKLPVYIEGSQFKIASLVNDKDKDYPKAAKMFRDFVGEFPKSKFSPIALAKAFYIYQDAKQLDAAIQAGEEMFKEYPKADSAEWKSLPNGTTRDKDILPDLLFALAKNYERTADFETAAAKYELFVKTYPKDERIADAEFNAAHWYEGLGESEKAIKAYDGYIKIFDAMKPADIKRLNLPAAASVFYEEALIYERDKNWKAEYTQLENYLRLPEYRSVISAERWREINAKYKMFLAAKEMPKPPHDPMAICEEMVKTYNGSGFSQADKQKESTKLAVAHCRFLQVEPQFAEYEKLVFKSPATLKKDLEKKKALKLKLGDEYKKIVEYGNGDYAIASLVRLSQLEKLFSKALTDAPVPKNLDADQQEMYRAQLENIAFQYEQPAIDGIQLALKTAFDKGIYDEWTLKAEDMMKEFKPEAFDDVKEFPLKGSEFFFTAGAIKPGGTGSGGN